MAAGRHLGSEQYLTIQATITAITAAADRITGRRLQGTCLAGECRDLLADAHELGQQVKCVIDGDGAVYIEAHCVLSGQAGGAGRN